MRAGLLLCAAATALLSLGLASPANAQRGGDPPDNATTRAQLTADQPVRGSLEAGDADWYRLNVTAGQMYTITMNSAEGEGALADPYLILLDSSGNEITRNDDAGGTLNSRLRYMPQQSGEVFVAARAFSDQDSGAFVLGVTASTPPPDNAGNDMSSSARLSVGEGVTDDIAYEGDTDWYRLSTTAGRLYTITLDSAGEGEGQLADPLLIVHNAAGEAINSNDDAEPGTLNSRLVYYAREDGDVWVEARGLSESYTGGYRLAAAESMPPADPATADATTRARIRAGQLISANLDYPGDSDWYRLSVSGGRTYRIWLTSDQGAEQPLGDPLLRVLDASGAEVTQNDDAGASLNSYVEYTPDRSGHVFIEAAGFDGAASGAYTLRVEMARR